MGVGSRRTQSQKRHPYAGCPSLGSPISCPVQSLGRPDDCTRRQAVARKLRVKLVARADSRLGKENAFLKMSFITYQTKRSIAAYLFKHAELAAS